MKTIEYSSLVEEYLAFNAVTKCPPGEALGADGLRNWASERQVGNCRVFVKKKRK